MRISSSMTIKEFEHIAIVLRPSLKDIGRQFFGDDDTAEDVAQETLMRLWMLRERINSEMGPEALAIRMAKNLCVSEWRKQKVRQGKALEVELAAHDDTQHNMEIQESIRRLRRAVSRLTPTEQCLFRMRHEAEMNIQQIAAVTGIGARSVSAMLSTAKRKLLEILNPNGGIQ